MTVLAYFTEVALLVVVGYLVYHRMRGVRTHPAVLGMFIVLAVAALGVLEPVQERAPPMVTVPLLFVSLALPLVAVLATDAFRPVPGPVAGTLTVTWALLAVLIAAPDGDFRLVFSLFVTYVVLGYGYALSILVHGVRTVKNGPRFRYIAAALATLATALGFLVALLAIPDYVPEVVTEAVFNGAYVVAALGYLAAFAPPRWVRELVRSQVLRHYLESLPPGMGPERARLVGSRLQEAALNLGEGRATLYELHDGALEAGGKQFAIDEGPLADALRVGKPTTLMARQLGDAERALALAPVDHLTVLPIEDDHVLIVESERRSLFPEGQLETLALLARHASLELRAFRGFERLAEVELFKSQFLRGIGHELANPLSPIQLQARLLRSDPEEPLGPRQESRLQVIERNAARLQALIRDLSDVAHMQEAKLSVYTAPTDLQVLIEGAVRAYQDMARRSRCEIQTEGGSMPLEVDPERVGQVLDNLLSNAIKYSPDGGKIQVSWRRDGERAVVEVTDHGLGLTQEQMDSIFRPYSRVHSQQAPRVPGTGLGLYIAKGLVEAHGGRLEASSAGAGQGSTFTFWLPLPTEAEP